MSTLKIIGTETCVQCGKVTYFETDLLEIESCYSTSSYTCDCEPPIIYKEKPSERNKKWYYKFQKRDSYNI